MASTRLSFSYPEDLKTQVQEEAEKESRSVSSMIQVFIKEGLKKREDRKEKRRVTAASRRAAAKRKTA